VANGSLVIGEPSLIAFRGRQRHGARKLPRLPAAAIGLKAKGLAIIRPNLHKLCLLKISAHQSLILNFQVTVLKILASYPGGHATLADLKRDMAVLITSGNEWAERTKRLAGQVPGLDIFSQGLVERLHGSWKITERGRAVLESMADVPASPPDRSTQKFGLHADEEDDPT
jgi:hypothetical protein